MLKLMIGVKGTGKTKALVNMVNEACEASKGHVVCLEKGVKLTYDVKHQARLINTNDYLVFDAQSLFGFISGIMASDHDVTDIFVDSAKKICNDDMVAFEKMVLELDENGTVLNPECGKRPSSEFKMHLQAYKVSPRANAVVHNHSAYATAFAAAGQPICSRGLRAIEAAPPRRHGVLLFLLRQGQR